MQRISSLKEAWEADEHLFHRHSDDAWRAGGAAGCVLFGTAVGRDLRGGLRRDRRSAGRRAGQPERLRKGMREIYLYSLVVMVVTVLLMQVSAEWLVRMVSGSSEALVLENGARYLRWTSPFYAVLGVLLSTRYALQSLGEKVLPLFSSVIEFLGKVVFVLVFIPRFAYNAVILCEPVVWCFMALYLVAVYRCNPFVFPKKQ